MPTQKHTQKPNRIWLLLTLISQAVAIGFHIYLTKTHYDLNYSNVAGQSLCNINSFLNCDAVSASPYSSLFGLPLALWGAATNLLLAIFVLIQAFASYELRNKMGLLNAWFASFVLTVSLVMAAISFTQMDAFCLFCSFTWLCSFLTVLFLILGLRRPQLKNFIGGLKPTYKFAQSPKILLSVIFIPAVAVGSHFVYIMQFPVKDMEASISEYISTWKQNEKFEFDIDQAMSMGASRDEARVTIIEFSDFYCGHCKHAAPVLHAFTKSRTDVRFVFVPFPLDGSCNPHVPFKGDGMRCFLAKAVYCANKTQKGWALHDYIFGADHQVNDQELLKHAQSIGIDSRWLEKCVQAEETQTWIAKQCDAGHSAQLDGTPSVFVNGRYLPAGNFYMILEKAYKESL
jgi:protein-disulfide isomerase/uncharacterized membrane protein